MFWNDLDLGFWRRQWHPTPVLLPGKSHGQRSLVGCSPCGRKESDTTERLHFLFSVSCIGEGNGNPLQCSCLENPRDGEPGGLPSMGSHRVGHDWSNLAAAAAAELGFQMQVRFGIYVLLGLKLPGHTHQRSPDLRGIVCRFWGRGCHFCMALLGYLGTL